MIEIEGRLSPEKESLQAEKFVMQEEIQKIRKAVDECASLSSRVVELEKSMFEARISRDESLSLVSSKQRLKDEALGALAAYKVNFADRATRCALCVFEVVQAFGADLKGLENLEYEDMSLYFDWLESFFVDFEDVAGLFTNFSMGS